MLVRLKKFLALFLAGTILLAGSGFGDAYGAAMAHGLGLEATSSAPAPDGDFAKKCEHGCAGHLNVHLVVLTGTRSIPPVVDAAPRQQAGPSFSVIQSRPAPHFRPPRTFLA